MGWWRDLFGGSARKDEQAAGVVTALRVRVSSDPSLGMARVTGIQQDGRRGMKAWISLDPAGEIRDSFFWHVHDLSVGDVVVIRSSVGFGPHTRRDDVIFIGSERGGPGVLDRIPARTVQRAARHDRRQQAG